MTSKTISHYKILEKLGEGGMGVVYKAEDTKLKRIVALKFLPQDLTRDEKSRKRFMHEAQAASVLDHPNIGTIYEVDQTEDGQMFIAMACYEGESLKDKIENGPLPLDLVIDVASQIAKGLSKAHSKEIIHRDIKPANILIAEDAQVKIVDFGLAKLAVRTRLTKSGITLGTPAYMSPEQAQGVEVEHHTDLWALGVVLYEMVTGKQPFPGEYEQAVMYSIMHEEPEPMTGVRTGVPMELERIVNKCLQKQPSDRYQHADELLVDLRQCHKSTGMVQTSTVTARASKRAWFIGAALTVFAVMLILYFSGIFSPGTKDGTNERIMLAVLPFENLGEPEDAYFADGISDEILTKLTTIPQLGVIARESSFKYRNNEKSIAELGDALGVKYLLKGAIRWQRTSEGTSQVRITPKLISVAENRNVWADAYDGRLDDIFAMQAHIAEQVSQSLRITLTANKSQKLREKPTKNLEAYNYFLRGKEIWHNAISRRERWFPAEEYWNKAVALDSNFALAHAWLSFNHTLLYAYNLDPRRERAEKAKNAYVKALGLNPDLSMAYLAKGLYSFFIHYDHDNALRAINIAQKLAPGDWWPRYSIGLVKWYQGYYQEAIKYLNKAGELNPGAFQIPDNLGRMYRQLRKFQESEETYKRLISVWPDLACGHRALANMYISWEGNTATARQTIEAASQKYGRQIFIRTWHYIYILEGKYEQALECLNFASYDSLEFYLTRAKDLYLLFDRDTEYKLYADSARKILEARIASYPPKPEWHRDLGYIYACLGDKEKAIAAGKKAVELRPVSKDANYGPGFVAALAAIYVLVGEFDAAIDQLEYLLSIPSFVTIPLLKIEPEWEPLREHPRFQKLIGEEGLSSK